jgi:hypothetical protein
MRAPGKGSASQQKPLLDLLIITPKSSLRFTSYRRDAHDDCCGERGSALSKKGNDNESAGGLSPDATNGVPDLRVCGGADVAKANQGNILRVQT